MKSYIRKVFYSEEDRCWVAIAPELDGCSAVGDSDTEALKELDSAIKGHLEIRKQRGWPIPKPLAAKEPQGRFLLRIPKSLQAELAEAAAEEGVSLNQYMLYLLAKGGKSEAASYVRDRRGKRF